jgi:putative hydrolase
VTDDGPFGDDDNPFGDLPFFGDLSKLFQTSGPINWEAAQQFAQSLATEGTSEPNVEPADRIKIEQLARIAELQVANATGLDPTSTGNPAQIVTVTRAEWARRTLDAYRSLFERLAGRLTSAPPDSSPEAPEAQLLGGLFQFLNPMMMAMTSGSMAGHLAKQSLGQYHLPIPRVGDDVLVLSTNINEFADEWSIPVDDVRLWVCVHDLTFHSVLSIPHVATAINEILGDYIDGFQSDPMALESKLGELEVSGSDPMDLQGQLQSILGDPEALLGAMRTSEQDTVVPKLEALLGVIIGYVDHVLDEVGSGLIASIDLLAEAFRRKRVTAGPSDRFVTRLLGLDLRPEVIEEGARFVAGVIERAGEGGLRRLWEIPQNLPTPNEVAAPGLWLARIDLPDTPQS